MTHYTEGVTPASSAEALDRTVVMPYHIPQKTYSVEKRIYTRAES